MNETLHSAKNHIQKQKKIYLFLIVLFTLGIISGIIYIFLLSDVDRTLLVEEVSSFFQKMKTWDNLSYGSSFVNSVLSNLLYVIGVWLLGISIIGLPFILFLLLMRGFVFGFSIASIPSIYGFKGVLGSFLYLLPQQIVLVPLALLLTFHAMSFSIKLFSHLFLKKNINLKEAMRYYLKTLLIASIGAIVASLLEVFVNPYLIRLFTSLI